jgi:CheY-like chemotaxis protein
VEQDDGWTTCLLVTDLTDQRQRESLVADQERKDRFLAMLGHELRNPLASIAHAAHVLAEHDGRLEGPHRRQMTDIIGRQSENLKRLVDDLLDVARATRGSLSLERQRVDLREVVRRSVEALVANLERHDLRLALESSPVWVDADPVRMNQVLENLLVNAVKHTPAGGRIEVAVRAQAREVLVEVRDEGSGISSEMMSRMFRPFERGADSAGLGLGLALVERLVEMHEGSVTAASEGPGRGASFTVRLPTRDGPPAAWTAAQGAGPKPAGGKRLLVVDDHHDAVEAIALLLEADGFEVHVAHSGTAALEAAPRIRPHAILLDIGLPGLDGCEVARQLRANGFADTLLVAITGYGEHEHRRRSEEAGFDHHLVKPVDVNKLREVLSAL